MIDIGDNLKKAAEDVDDIEAVLKYCAYMSGKDGEEVLTFLLFNE